MTSPDTERHDISPEEVLKQLFDDDSRFEKKGVAFVSVQWTDSRTPNRRYGHYQYVHEKYLIGRKYTLSLAWERPPRPCIEFEDEYYVDGAEIRRLTDTKLEPEKFGR